MRENCHKLAKFCPLSFFGSEVWVQFGSGLASERTVLTNIRSLFTNTALTKIPGSKPYFPGIAAFSPHH